MLSFIRIFAEEINVTLRRVIMNTITIDPLKYRKAEAYAQKRNISIETLVENYFDQLDNERAVRKRKYYISPKIEAMRVGFKCPENSTFDYKSEIRDILADKYL